MYLDVASDQFLNVLPSILSATTITVGGNNPGGDTNKPGDDKKKYKVTVNYGSGSGEYEAGATVNITANAPESSSKVFSRWTTSNSGLGKFTPAVAVVQFVKV